VEKYFAFLGCVAWLAEVVSTRSSGYRIRSSGTTTVHVADLRASPFPPPQASIHASFRGCAGYGKVPLHNPLVVYLIRELVVASSFTHVSSVAVLPLGLALCSYPPETSGRFVPQICLVLVLHDGIAWCLSLSRTKFPVVQVPRGCPVLLMNDKTAQRHSNVCPSSLK